MGTQGKSRKLPSYIASAVRKQRMNGMEAWAANHQSLPPVTHFLQLGAKVLRVLQPLHWLETKCWDT